LGAVGLTPIRGALRNLTRVEEIGVIAGLLAIALYLTLHPTSSEAFRQPYNLLQVARQASYFGMMAVAMVFVLSMGDVDLSVGSILTLVNISTALAMRNGIGVETAVLMGLSLGALCGFANGTLSVLLRIPAIIITLGTMSLYRGIALVISDASPISQFPKNNAFFEVGGGQIAGIPASVIVMILVGAAGYVLFNMTAFGWRVQAIGSNSTAARYSGIAIAKNRILVMTLMGAVAGLAGVTALAFLQSADPTTGSGFELQVIASAILGGTALTGGSGSIPGAILGALLIALIANGLVLLEYNAYWGVAVTGAVIILAVAFGNLIRRKET
jgi:ribose transport system permease protein